MLWNRVRGQRQQTARPRWWALPLLGVLWFASLFYVMQTTLNHDVAWFLFAANRFLDGAELYRDIVEVNPPLVIYHSVAPVAVARLTGLEPITCLMVYVFLLIGFSLAICNHLLKMQADRSPEYRVGMLLRVLPHSFRRRWPCWGSANIC
jgi:hypothetical protein